jgi:hypothetical protein
MGQATSILIPGYVPDRGRRFHVAPPASSRRRRHVRRHTRCVAHGPLLAPMRLLARNVVLTSPVYDNLPPAGSQSNDRCLQSDLKERLRRSAAPRGKVAAKLRLVDAGLPASWLPPLLLTIVATRAARRSLASRAADPINHRRARPRSAGTALCLTFLFEGLANEPKLVYTWSCCVIRADRAAATAGAGYRRTACPAGPCVRLECWRGVPVASTRQGLAASIGSMTVGIRRSHDA